MALFSMYLEVWHFKGPVSFFLFDDITIVEWKQDLASKMTGFCEWCLLLLTPPINAPSATQLIFLLGTGFHITVQGLFAFGLQSENVCSFHPTCAESSRSCAGSDTHHLPPVLAEQAWWSLYSLPGWSQLECQLPPHQCEPCRNTPNSSLSFLPKEQYSQEQSVYYCLQRKKPIPVPFIFFACLYLLSMLNILFSDVGNWKVAQSKQKNERWHNRQQQR